MDKEKQVDKDFKLSVANKMLALLIVLMMLGAMIYCVRELDTKPQTKFGYNNIGANITVNGDFIGVNYTFGGNYTLLIEYQNVTKDVIVLDDYSVIYEMNNIITNMTYSFKILNCYDDIYIIIRNDDLKFSEGHKIK